MEMVRWGIIGIGKLAEEVAPDFARVAGADLVAVASRTQDRADAFAARHGAEKAYGSYRALLDDESIDVVHITTPHPHHRDIALAAIERGKAVLVEKAFTATLAGAREVVDAAREKGVFCMEAMWTRFIPAIQAAKEVIAWGRIGDVLSVSGHLGFRANFDPLDRLFAHDLGGGSILDLGVYPVSLAQHFLGEVKDVTCAARLLQNGVDGGAAITLRHTGDALSALTCGVDTHGPARFVVQGTKGWIDIEPPFHHSASITVNRAGVLPRVIEMKPVGKGYAHQYAEVTRRLRAGHTESPTMPLADTLEIMGVLEECTRQAGVTYREATVDLG